jgi:RNA polymerase sigma-70 factor (ECF subfamily)
MIVSQSYRKDQSKCVQNKQRNAVCASQRCLVCARLACYKGDIRCSVWVSAGMGEHVVARPQFIRQSTRYHPQQNIAGYLRAGLGDYPLRCLWVVFVDAEAALRESWKAKDPKQTLTLLMSHYGDAVYRHCSVMLPGHLVADVHQQTFIEAYRALPSFEGRSSFKTWLYTITRHRCLDALKSERRWWQRFTRESIPEETPSAEDSVVDRLEQHELLAALDVCLRLLPPLIRTAVALRYQEGFSYEEMSLICLERAGTLQQRVARALPMLRRCVESKGNQ